MIKYQSRENYKVALKIEVPQCYKNILGNDYIYIVPINKAYKMITTDYLQRYNSDSKKVIALIPHGNTMYNSSIRIHDDGTWSQYVDGSFYEYVGRIAL